MTIPILLSLGPSKVAVANVSLDYGWVEFRIFESNKVVYYFRFSLPDNYAERPADIVLQLAYEPTTPFYAIGFGRGIMVHSPNKTSMMTYEEFSALLDTTKFSQEDKEIQLEHFTKTASLSQENLAYLHVISHPVLTEIHHRMITSILFKGPSELVIGTALGCVWNVHPTNASVLHFQLAFPRCQPIRHLTCDTDIVAITIRDNYVIPPISEDQPVGALCVPSPRPLYSLARGDTLLVFSKYGSIIFYDLKESGKTSHISPPAEACKTLYIMPWYKGIWLSPNGKRLHVLYPDGLCVAYQLE